MKTLNLKFEILKSAAIIAAFSPLFMSCDDDPNDKSGWDKLPNLNIDENSTKGTIVGEIQASGADFTYSITSGNDNNAFSIDPATGIITVEESEALNHEVTESFKLDVSAQSKAETLFGEVIISVNDLEDERYLEYVFKDDAYRNPTSISYGNSQYHVLEMYLPLGDTETKRPVVLTAGGGAFGKPSHKPSMNGMAWDMAQRGFVAAYVNFTQINGDAGLAGDPEPTYQKYVEASVQQIKDLRGAIRFLRKNADQYGIDPDMIFLAGWSTGGVMMNNAAFIDEGESADTGNPELDAYLNSFLDGLEGDLNPGYSHEVQGLVSMMTYLETLSVIDANDPPTLFINHEEATTDTDCTPGLGQLRTGIMTGRLPFNGQDVFLQGTSKIFDKMTELGMNNGEIREHTLGSVIEENMDYNYLMLKGYNGIPANQFCPNSSVMTNETYNFIANFFHSLVTEI